MVCQQPELTISKLYNSSPTGFLFKAYPSEVRIAVIRLPPEKRQLKSYDSFPLSNIK